MSVTPVDRLAAPTLASLTAVTRPRKGASSFLEAVTAELQRKARGRSTPEVRVGPEGRFEVEPGALAGFITGRASRLAPGETLVTSFQLVDGAGVAHAVEVRLRLLAGGAGEASTFAFDLVVGGGEVEGGTPGLAVSLLTGEVAGALPGIARFDAEGMLLGFDAGSGPIAPGGSHTLALPAFTSGAAASSVTLFLSATTDDDTSEALGRL